MSVQPVLAAEDLGDLILGWELITSLPAILAIAFVAGRLLGVRRSWTTAVASGVVGCWPGRVFRW
jgi:hypothetical protein